MHQNPQIYDVMSHWFASVKLKFCTGKLKMQNVEWIDDVKTLTAALTAMILINQPGTSTNLRACPQLLVWLIIKSSTGNNKGFLMWTLICRNALRSSLWPSEVICSICVVSDALFGIHCTAAVTADNRAISLAGLSVCFGPTRRSEQRWRNQLAMQRAAHD